ncbi:phage portal protein [Roseomonas elaeocarpi]|uniref:Phage portal protein n=1 Tax=Roseomonas elaeocarpi TaxID=907779 RepID=A0ABV6JZA6_9PROT
MSFWSRLIGREERSAAPRYGSLELFRDLLTGGRVSKSGVTVSADQSLYVTAVLAGCRVIAEDTSGLPLKLIQQQGKKRSYLTEDPVQQVLDWPNDWQSGPELREQLTLHAVLCGNGYAWKNVVRGEVRELLPLLPQWVVTTQDKDWGVIHKVTLPDGTSFGLKASEVLHLRGPSWSGFAGLEIFRLAREAIGLAVATETAHAKLHSNGLHTSGLYSVEGALGKPDYDLLRAHIEANFIGEDNLFRPLILDRNAKFTPISMTGVDAQHLETRKNQIEEIARALRVFPQMIGHSDKTSTFASAEAFFLAHVKYSLLPWCLRWERTVQRDLIGKSRSGVFVKHNVAALERADIKTRYAAYGQAIKDGWLVRNEARGWEDLDEIEGLSEPLQPLNMATPGQAEDDGQQDAGGQPTKGRRPFADDLRSFDPSKHPRDENGKFKGRGAGRRRVRRMAQRSIADGKHQDTLDLGGIARPEFNGAAGQDVQGWRMGLMSDQVRHIHKEHGSARTEMPRGQLPIGPDDFTRVRALVHGGGAVAPGGLTRVQKIPTVVVKGAVGNARYELTLTVNKRHRALRVHTLIKRPK